MLPVVGMEVVQRTVNPPSETLVTRRLRVLTPVTRVAVAVGVEVVVEVRDAVGVSLAVDVRDAVGELVGEGVLVADGVPDAVADAVREGVSDAVAVGIGVTVASRTMTEPAIPAAPEDTYWYVPAIPKSRENDPPGEIGPESHVPSAARTEWVVVALVFVHRTISLR
jgi:hypothetical protein